MAANENQTRKQSELSKEVNIACEDLRCGPEFEVLVLAELRLIRKAIERGSAPGV